jgi:hypothetical protein
MKWILHLLLKAIFDRAQNHLIFVDIEKLQVGIPVDTLDAVVYIRSREG